MKTRICFAVAVLMLFAAMASACTDRKKEPFDRSEHTTLKVMGYGDERSFYSMYGDDFNSEYPNVEFDFVSFQGMDPGQSIETFIEAEKPDIVIAQSRDYTVLAKSGLLAELDPLIRRDRYDLSTISPPVMNLLRATNGNTLYGLAPAFHNSVVFYNAALFRQYQIEPPRDRMTWEELLRLAMRFPAESGMSGLSLDRQTSIRSLGGLFVQIGLLNGLRLAASSQPDTLTLDSEGWLRTAEIAVSAYRSGALSIDESKQILPPDDYIKKNRFIAGDSAMTIGGFNLLQLIEHKDTPAGDLQPIDLGIVTTPIDPSRPDIGTFARLRGVLCLYKDSEHREAAWAFIQYLGGDDYAKLKSKSSVQLLSRASYQKDLVPGISLEPFYTQHADPDFDETGGVDPRINGGLVDLFDQKLKQAATGETSIQEAVAAMKSEGDELIKSWREKVSSS